MPWVILGDDVDEVQLFLRLHQLFGLQKEDMLLFFQPAFFFQLPLLGLRHLADEDIAHGLVGHRVPEEIELRPVPLVAGGLVGHHPILRHGGLAPRTASGESRVVRSMLRRYAFRSLGWMVGAI